MNTWLFFDDFVLDDCQSIQKRHFSPQKVNQFQTENISSGACVTYIPEIKQYRLYYTTIMDMSKDWDRSICYAHSKDGQNFEPAGVIEELEHIGSLFVNRDTRATNKKELYKSIIIQMEDEKKHKGKGIVVTSEDGLHWNLDTPYQVTDYPSDTTNSIFYNPVLDMYQMICRGGFIDRRITSVFSKDLIKWTKPMLTLSPTPFDPPFTQYYGMTVYPMDGLFLGFLQIYQTEGKDTVWSKMAGKVDTALMYSYNGMVWNRVNDQPLVQRPMPPQTGSSCIYFQSMYPHPDQKHWLMSASTTTIDHGCGFSPAYPDWDIPAHAKEKGSNHVSIYQIRKHGFTGLESIGRKGTIRSKRMYLKKDRLYCNICAPNGSVRFQLSDEDYRPIEGFTFKDSKTFTGDEIQVTPEWEKRSLKEMIHRSFFFEIEMQTALLFSIEGDFMPHHGSKPFLSMGDPKPFVENSDK